MESCQHADIWREIAQHEHLAHIYENKTHFLNIREGFAGTGILSGHTLQGTNKWQKNQGIAICGSALGTGRKGCGRKFENLWHKLHSQHRFTPYCAYS